MPVPFIVYLLILLGGIGSGLFRFRELPASGKWLLLLLIYVFFKEIAAYVIALKSGNNLRFYQYLSIVDFYLTAMVFYAASVMKPVRNYLLGTVVLVLAFYAINTFFIQVPGVGADTNFKIVKSLVLILVGLVLFFRLANNPDSNSLLSKSLFWFAFAIVVANVCGMFYWGAYNYFLGKQPAPVFQVMGPVFIVSNYLLYLFSGLALFLKDFSFQKMEVHYAI